MNKHGYSDLEVVQSVVAGKWGELYEDHELGVLLGCPAPFPTTATMRLTDTGGVTVSPEGYFKTRRLVEVLLRTLAPRGTGAEILINSSQQDGCGQATSTWSMLAAAKATFDLLKIPPDYALLAEEMVKIEPTDAIGVRDGQMVLWDFKRGRRLSREHPSPRAGFVGAVPLGRRLLTDEVHHQRPTYTPAERQSLARVLIALEGVLSAGLVEALAEFASTSIEINARYFPLPEIDALRQLKRAKKIHGYFGAHSGTCFGAICDSDPGRVGAVFSEFRTLFGPGYRIVAWTHDPDQAASLQTRALFDVTS